MHIQKEVQCVCVCVCIPRLINVQEVGARCLIIKRPMIKRAVGPELAAPLKS